jgi:hypothetical protein
MHKYQIGKLAIDRVSDNQLELNLDGKKVKVFTEDLAALVREELPKDRAADLFAHIEEKMISQGKVRVIVEAKYDIKKGDYVCFTFDINRYLDKIGRPIGVRTNNFGFIY